MKGAAVLGAVIVAAAALLSRQRRFERETVAAIEERDEKIANAFTQHSKAVNRVLERFVRELAEAAR